MKEPTFMALRLVRDARKEAGQTEQKKSRAEYLIACLREETQDSRFTDWERDFIASLARRLEMGRTLSEKQKETLERIWEK
jgi:hypothetical protein